MAKNKTIIEGDAEIENRADDFAINTMISMEHWNEIKKELESNCPMSDRKNKILYFSKKYKIAPSFIVGRMAKMNMINYNSKIYNELKDV